MKVLVCNAGSTSLKFKLYDMPSAWVLAQCRIERVGSADDALFSYVNYENGWRAELDAQSIPDYCAGIGLFIAHLTEGESAAVANICEVERVGYKATLSKGHFGVHEIDGAVLQGMRDWLVLAKLHNTAYLETMQLMRELLPGALFLGAYETSFHRDIPLARKLYALPYEWYEQYGVQRLGYHSASHGYIADVLNRRGSQYRAISCHLGGSCSVCAIKDGGSIDTSFGMSLQSGVMHAARVGDMDGDLFMFLKSEGLSEQEIVDGMTTKGGLLGISGVSSDLRYVQQAAENGNTRAQLAIDMFVASIVHYAGAFYVDLEGLDYLVFTGGIGENSALVRRLVCEKLAVMGVRLEAEKNVAVQGETDISAEDSAVRVLVIPTDEELGIARRTYEFTHEETEAPS